MFYCSPCSLNRQPSWSQIPRMYAICIHLLIVNSSFLFLRSDPLPGWENSFLFFSLSNPRMGNFISFLFFLQSPDGKYLSFLSPIPGWEISFFSFSNPRMGNIFIQSPDGKFHFFSFLSPIPGWEISFFSFSNPRMGNIVLFFLQSPDGKYLYPIPGWEISFLFFLLSTLLLSLLQREILDAAVVVSAVGQGLISRLK
jgi:hypothetical protein